MTGRRGVVAVLLAASVMGATPAAGAVIELAAQRDNTLFEDAAGSLSSGAGPAVFAGRNSQGLIRRALVRFDVASSLPQGAIVSSAVLRLNLSNVSDPTTRVLTLHRVERDWGEGTSSSGGGSGAPAATGDATWLHASWTGSLWSNAGGDFAPVASASQTVGDLGVYAWTGPSMVSDVQGWLDHPDSNFGWIVVGDETVANTARRFDSRENAVTADRPALIVTYGIPVAVLDPGAADGAFLGPCRPNPSSGAVSFMFSIPREGHVELIVTDVRGRRAETLVNETLGAGLHEVIWERNAASGGRPAASGVYFYRLSVDGKPVATRRRIALR